MSLSSWSTGSQSQRQRQDQRGNALVYVIGFAILWFLFFAIKDWILATKEARDNPDRKSESSRALPEDDPYLRSRD